jgi:copper oxidase (laccase) domain-containing protein
VGDEVRAAFLQTDDAAAAAFEPTRPGHWLCDLYALARQRLASAGVQRISGGGFDTFADARFYSYRRDGKTGRFAGLIWLDPATVKATDREQADTGEIAAPIQPVFAFSR